MTSKIVLSTVMARLRVRRPPRRRIRLVAIPLLACLPAASVEARVLVLRGTVGALNDWALQVQLGPPGDKASDASYVGSFSLRHTGICTTKDHDTKAGTATAAVRGTSLYGLALKFDDEDCVLEGPVKLAPDRQRNILRCGKSKQVPLVTWWDGP